jgi:beta-N-acetylhexosaminidase
MDEFSVSELFIVGYEGTTLPEPLLSRYARGDFAGLIFFSRNFANLSDLRQIAESLAELGRIYEPPGALAELPPILSVDHEGGRVQRIKAPLTVWPPMHRLAELPTPGAEEVAEAVGRAMALELGALGFNVDFAPVLDVHTNPANPVIGDRAFGTTPEAVSARALAFWRGLEASGKVRGCGKHFPGHGDTATDSHFTLPVVHHSEERLRAVELAPFADAVRAGASMLMTAHVVYPAIDNRPATLSRRWLTDILRGELGYEGVILSDDLDMRALGPEHLAAWTGNTDPGELVVESLLAGCDAFLLCRDADRQAGAEEALRRAALARPDVRARLCESAARLRRFRKSLYGPLPERPLGDPELVARMPLPEHEALKLRLK